MHTNSGVGNKAAFLITDGGTFNGHTVTGLGLDKMAAIFYEADTNLLISASDYADLGDALRQGCTNLVGTGGITPADCTQVAEAVAPPRWTSSRPTSGDRGARVPGGETPIDLFFDDLENTASGNWALSRGPRERLGLPAEPQPVRLRRHLRDERRHQLLGWRPVDRPRLRRSP